MPHHASLDNVILKRRLRALLQRRPAALILSIPGLALAGPTGEDVIRGDAHITRPDATRTVIDQLTDRAAINWQSFNIDADEFVIFNQPGASSIVLNRVLGGDASYILGQMQANGQVFLLNPDGVYFTHGASLDVQGFLGSTLDMDPDAFMAGNFQLTRNSSSPANTQVVNDGRITAGPGGYVVLAGDYTENTGIIAANAGTVALVSGNAMTLDIEGDGLVSFAVDEATLSEAAGVRNAGSLIADGGRVIMTAKVASDLVATAVNNEGLVRAHAVEQREGEIYLVGYGGDVSNSGTLDADGENANGGGIALYSDRDVTLADGGVQTAAGDADHSGGVVRAIAEEHLKYQEDNLIRVTGGTSGGFVEVSGHGSLALRGIPDIGRGGTYFIDPATIEIIAGGNSGSTGQLGVDLIKAQLEAGIDVILAASNSITATSVPSLTTAGSAGGNLTIGIGNASPGSDCGFFGLLCTAPDIFTQTGNGTINLGSMDIDIGGSVTIEAGNTGRVTTANITTGGGITITGGRQINTGNLTAAGDISLSGTGASFNTAGQVFTGAIDAGGMLTVHADQSSPSYGGGIIQVTGGITADSVSLTANGRDGHVRIGNSSGGVAINATNDISINATGTADNGGRIEIGTGMPEANFTGGKVVSTNGNIDMTADGPNGVNGGVIVAGSINAAGDVNLTADGGSSDGGHIHLGDYASALFTAANVTAGGALALTAHGNRNAVIDAGNLRGASVTVTADTIHTVEYGAATIRIGNASANGAVSSGNILISAVGASTGAALIETGSLHAGGSLSVDAQAGSATANGSVLVNGNVVAANAASISNFFGNVGNVTINGSVRASEVRVFANGGDIKTGNIEALGSLGTAGSFSRGAIRLDAGGNIETGSLTAINDRLGADINLDASFGNITINGDVTATGAKAPGFADTRVWMSASNGGISINGDLEASGYGGPGDGRPLPGVSVDLSAGGAGAININGGVTVTGHAGSYSNGTTSGVAGDAIFYAWANGSGNLDIDGPVKVTGTGHAEADLYGRNVTTGNITVVANPGSRMESGQSSGATFTENAVRAGMAEIIIDTGVVSGIGEINVGDLIAKGPNANIHLVDATAFNTGAITVNATGDDLSFSSSYGGNVFEETRQGGSATFFAGQDDGTASNMAIDISGGINVTAVGRGSVVLQGTQVATRSISVTAAGGTFSREGTQRISGSEIVQCDGPCSFSNSDWPYDGEFGGPRVDTGTVVAGAATLHISGMPAGIGFSSGSMRARNVLIGGNVAVNGAGTARVGISGDDIAITGNIDAVATRAQVNGAFTDSGSTTSGASTFINGTVTSSVGVAGVEIDGLFDAAHAVNVGGAITVSGPRAKFNASGGTVTVGNVSVEATGFDIDMMETETDSTGAVIETFNFQGSHLVTGNGIEAVGAINAGDIRIEGPGAAGIIFKGDTITTGGITVRASAGAFTALTPSYNGGVQATEPTGAAVLGFESPNVATVNGDIVVEGALTAHVGGRANVSGDFAITGGKHVLGAIPGYVDFLDHIDDGDTDEEPLVLPVAAIRAANVSASVTNGNLGLGTAQFTTAGTMTLNAGGDVNFASRTQDAGSFVITAGNGVNISSSTLAAAGVTTVTAGAAINASGAQLRATDLALSGQSVSLQGAVAEASGTIDVVARSGTLNLDNATLDASGAMQLEAGTDITVSNVSLDAAAIAMIAGGDIRNFDPPGTIRAGTLAVLAGGNVDLGNTTLMIGSGSIASVPGDTRFLELLATEGVATAAAGPSLVISAQNITLGRGSIAGDYVYLETGSLAVNGSFTTSNPNLLLQVAPLGAGATFSFEQSTASGGDAAYVYNNALSAFNAATIALGSTDHTGDVRISTTSATVDIGDTNLFVLTQGSVRGLDRVASTGIVKDLATLLGGGFDDIPQTDEIDINQDAAHNLKDEYALEERGGDDEEEGDEEGEDTDTDTDIEDDDNSLIRQDTVDEEMMCR